MGFHERVQKFGPPRRRSPIPFYRPRGWGRLSVCVWERGSSGSCRPPPHVGPAGPVDDDKSVRMSTPLAWWATWAPCYGPSLPRVMSRRAYPYSSAGGLPSGMILECVVVEGGAGPWGPTPLSRLPFGGWARPNMCPRGRVRLSLPFGGRLYPFGPLYGIIG